MSRTDSLEMLYKMALAETDLRHKRYLLNLATNVDTTGEQIEAEIRLRNLTVDAGQRIKNQEVAR